MAPASWRELSDLFKEHGSWDAVVEARPDLADEAREAQQQGELLSRAYRRGQADMLERYEKDRRKWEAIGEKRAEREAEEARLRRLQLEQLELHAAALEDDGPAATQSRPIVNSRKREPDKLEVERVDACEAKLRERARILVAGGRMPHELTQDGIGAATDVRFDRGRVQHVEQLLRLGWPLQKRLPEFSAEAGFVRLPSVEKAASALGLSDAEKTRRLAEKSLPLR